MREGMFANATPVNLILDRCRPPVSDEATNSLPGDNSVKPSSSC